MKSAVLRNVTLSDSIGSDGVAGVAVTNKGPVLFPLSRNLSCERRSSELAWDRPKCQNVKLVIGGGPKCRALFCCHRRQ